MTHRRSDHFDGRHFFNPTLDNARPASALPKMLAEKREPWPASIAVPQRAPLPHDDSAWVTLTFVGHSTFIIQTSSLTVITDPVFSERASPLSFIGPRRVRPPAVRIEQLPRIDLVLLSHNHYDHCDLASLKAIRQRFDPQLVTPLGNGGLVSSAGYTKVEELDWWDQARTTRCPLTMAPAQHFSARTPFDRNRALWGSFVMELEGRRLYFGGDSGYAPLFTEIRERIGDIDLALLPIGAYEPRWFMKPIHMNPAEAVQAHLDLGARQSVGMHFGTFQLTTEGIDEPLHALDRARRERHVPADAFRTLGFGESWQLPR